MKYGLENDEGDSVDRNLTMVNSILTGASLNLMIPTIL
jgi:hypothetical protein